MYPKNPTNLKEAAQVLSDFAGTAPGRLPEHIQVAIKVVRDHKDPQSIQGAWKQLTRELGWIGFVFSCCRR